MLVIPAIDLRRGHCMRRCGTALEEETEYYTDPVRMAKLWRVMNARVLHLYDHDGSLHGTPSNGNEATHNEPTLEAPHSASFHVLQHVAGALDIPLEASGGVDSLSRARRLLDAGIYRVVLTADASADASLLRAMIDAFGAGRVMPSVIAGHHRSVELAQAAAEAGARRLFVLRALVPDATADPSALRDIAKAAHGLRITAAAGIENYDDLLTTQALKPLGVDSVVLGQALYENRFPCQRFWCWHQKEGVDLDRFSTAPLASPS